MRIIVNGTKSKKMYFNGIPFWSVGHKLDNWFYIESISDNDTPVTIGRAHQVSSGLYIEYSPDCMNWTGVTFVREVSGSATICTIPARSRMYFRAVPTQGCWTYFGWTDLYNRFEIDEANKVRIGGDIRSLIFGANFVDNETEFPSSDLNQPKALGYIFNGCKALVDASNLILPPEMTLNDFCYQGMFKGCTSLINPPALPNDTLAGYCYAEMFEGCTSLEVAPYLPALYIEQASYQRLFKGCTNLREIKCNATGMYRYWPVDDWVNGVSSTGVFYKNADMTSWGTGASGIPEGWTIENL